MFQEKAVLFMYCISPVHAGAGTAIGTIDSPIQRERHTYHPTMAGSGIKGAMREHCEGQAQSANDTENILKVFGPKPDASNDYAGAVSFSDAQLVMFPVRSLDKSFVYATSPTALARLQRLLHLAGLPGVDKWTIPEPAQLKYVALGNPVSGNLILESFQFEPAEDTHRESTIAESIARWALPAGVQSYSFFRDKIEKDLVLLSDADFTHFVRHSTLVEPHVRISDESGTAEEGGLFYVENLPPETLLVSLVMASPDRKSKAGQMSAAAVMKFVDDKLNGKLVQMGGDSTTGRGQILLTLATKPAPEKEETS